jgi:hypothetical protein
MMLKVIFIFILFKTAHAHNKRYLVYFEISQPEIFTLEEFKHLNLAPFFLNLNFGDWSFNMHIVMKKSLYLAFLIIWKKVRDGVRDSNLCYVDILALKKAKKAESISPLYKRKSPNLFISRLLYINKKEYNIVISDRFAMSYK